MEGLPTEILKQHIFSCLDDKSTRQSRAVCTRWFDLIDYSNFTLYYTRPETLPEIVNRFSKYNKPIGLYFKKNVRLGEQLLLSHIGTLSNLTSLKITEIKEDAKVDDWQQLLKYYTNLKHLDVTAPLPSSISKHIPSSISVFDNTEEHIEVLQMNTSIEDLMLFSVKKLGETVVPLDLILNPSRLTKLVLDTINDDHNLARFTNLKELHLRDYVEGYHGLSDDEQLAISDPINYSKVPSLELLKIDAIKIDPDIHNNTKLTALHIKRAKSITEEYFRSVGTLTNLQVLSIQIDTETYHSSDWLSSLTLPNLASLKMAVTAEGSGFMKMQVDVAKLTRLKLRFENGFNFNTITHLTGLQRIDLIESAYEDGNYEESYLNFSLLAKFSNLTQLSVMSEAPLFREFPLKGLDSLKILAIDAYDIPAKEIRLLTNLDSLTFCGPISSEVLRVLGELTNLTELYFESDRLTGYNHPQLAKLPLKKLDLCSGNIDEDWIDTIIQITTLTSLAVPTLFNDENILRLTVLSDLTDLSIAHLDHGCKNLSYLTTLQVLMISNMDYNDPAAREIEENLKGLTRLWAIDFVEPEPPEDLVGDEGEDNI